MTTATAPSAQKLRREAADADAKALRSIDRRQSREWRREARRLRLLALLADR